MGIGRICDGLLPEREFLHGRKQPLVGIEPRQLGKAALEPGTQGQNVWCGPEPKALRGLRRAEAALEISGKPPVGGNEGCAFDQGTQQVRFHDKQPGRPAQTRRCGWQQAFRQPSCARHKRADQKPGSPRYLGSHKATLTFR